MDALGFNVIRSDVPLNIRDPAIYLTTLQFKVIAPGVIDDPVLFTTMKFTPPAVGNLIIVSIPLALGAYPVTAVGSALKSAIKVSVVKTPLADTVTVVAAAPDAINVVPSVAVPDAIVWATTALPEAAGVVNPLKEAAVIPMSALSSAVRKCKIVLPDLAKIAGLLAGAMALENDIEPSPRVELPFAISMLPGTPPVIFVEVPNAISELFGRYKKVPTAKLPTMFTAVCSEPVPEGVIKRVAALVPPIVETPAWIVHVVAVDGPVPAAHRLYMNSKAGDTGDTIAVAAAEFMKLRTLPTLSHVKVGSPPNTPLLLNWTSVLEPPGADVELIVSVLPDGTSVTFVPAASVTAPVKEFKEVTPVLAKVPCRFPR